ncbi:MAG: aminopeptidase [Candidatus Bathyarchaeota archaeon]|nr:MAG: aminopeptidase [Candidatus Bathyarchaeota archaeon]
MTLFDVEKLATLAVEYCLGVTEGKKVGIVANVIATPLIQQLYKQVLLEGGHPTVRAEVDGLSELFFQHSREEQLTFVSPFTKFFAGHIDGIIRVHAETNLKKLSGVPPEKLSKRSASQKEIIDLYMKRFTVGSYSIIPYPTEAFAQEAEMSLLEYENFVTNACFLDKRNPVKEWKTLSKQQERIVKHLNNVERIRIVGEDTDLKINVKGRTWINCDGHINMPDGEIFTGPFENSAEGQIRFTHPGIFMGKEVRDVQLVFKKGKVVEATAKKGQNLLNQVLATDPGAKRIGEIAIGTNKGITRFTKNMLFDEKMGNCIHMALGRSISMSGGKNKSTIHWDLLKDMTNGEIYADNTLIYEKGKLTI